MLPLSGALDPLRRELAALLDQFAQVLGDENRALRARDSAALEAAVARKLELLPALERATGNFCRAGGKLDPHTLGTVHQQAQSCARANRVNGGAIELGRAFAERLLDTLRGGDGSRATGTYDARGRVLRRDMARRMGLA